MIPKLLNQTLDSLDLRLFSHATPSLYIANQLQSWRKYKDDFDYSKKSEPYYVDFEGLGRFQLKASGHTPYEFVFVNDEIGQIYLLNPDKFATKFAINTGQIYLNFRSKWLQCQNDSYGLVDEFLLSCFSLFFERLKNTWVKVSRADLACDVGGSQFSWEDITKIASRSKKKDGLGSFCSHKDLKAVRDILSKSRPLNDNKGGLNDTSEKALLRLELTQDQLNILLELTNQAIEDPSVDRAIFGKNLQTLYIGRFASKIYARIYQKSEEIKYSGKEYLKKFWQEKGWQEGESVWRAEFSLSGDFLKEFLISDLNQDDFICLATKSFFDGENKSFKEITQDAYTACGTNLHEWQNFKSNINRLWCYCSQYWLRCTTGENSLNSRSPNSEFWDCVTSAFKPDHNFCRLPLPAPPSESKFSQLFEQGKGCIKSSIALVVGGFQIAFGNGTNDWKKKEFFDTFFDELCEELRSEITFDDIQERRDRYGCDDFSDTAFSAALRASHLKLGRGS